jgi:hypothetical protein
MSRTHEDQSTFLAKKTCDRCGAPLGAGMMMSWFTEEAICLGECHAKEQAIKRALREKGLNDAMEGCGYVPDPANVTVTSRVRKV